MVVCTEPFNAQLSVVQLVKKDEIWSIRRWMMSKAEAKRELSINQVTKRKAYSQKYESSDKGKASRQKYDSSDKGKASRHRGRRTVTDAEI